MREKMKKILVVLSLTLVFAITMVSLGIAYAGGIRGVGLIGVSFFFTSGVIVILVQLIPAGILFSSLIGSAFSSFGKGEMSVRAT
jgi:hypothetical protein